VLIYAIPFIVLCLVIAIKVERNMGFLVATLLYLFAAKNFSSSMSRILEWLASFERIWLITTGAIHGLTNLGGSLLTIAIHQKRYSKEVARATIAAAYITFAVVQLLTLIISKNIGLLSINNAKYLLIGMSIYLITNKMIYHRLNNQSYTKAFSAFLFCSGVLLTIKSL